MEIVFLPGGGAARFLARGLTLGGSFFVSACSPFLSGFCGVLKNGLIFHQNEVEILQWERLPDGHAARISCWAVDHREGAPHFTCRLLILLV